MKFLCIFMTIATFLCFSAFEASVALHKGHGNTRNAQPRSVSPPPPAPPASPEEEGAAGGVSLPPPDASLFSEGPGVRSSEEGILTIKGDLLLVKCKSPQALRKRLEAMSEAEAKRLENIKVLEVVSLNLSQPSHALSLIFRYILPDLKALTKVVVEGCPLTDEVRKEAEKLRPGITFEERGASKSKE